MLKQQAKLLTKIAMVVDISALVCAFACAYYVRSRQVPLQEFSHYLWVLLVALPTWHYLLSRYGLYASLRTCKFSDVSARLSKVHILGGIITSSAIYFVDNKGYSRGLVGYFLIFSFLFITAEKIQLTLILSYIRLKGYNTRNILVVGSAVKARQFIEIVQQHATWGLKIIGLVRLRGDAGDADQTGCLVLGCIDSLLGICKENAVDEVIFCLPNEHAFTVDAYLRELENMGITVRMVLDFYDVPRSKKELSFFQDEVPMLTFHGKSFDSEQLFLKRCIDIIGALVGMVLIALLFPFIVLAIRLDSPGPLLFSQRRVGQSGRTFHCWKFRSMYVDAEERKKELMRLNEMKGAMFKIKDDPRITRVGKFLRKTSLDELPQFWNVLRGEMSLVGTRPPTPDEVENYKNWQRKRICIKPGITGLWQVSGRNQIKDFDEVVSLDIEYIEKWTLWLDIRILVKTIWVVFARTGSS
jgi:exopolysaccharide biosynthesis polyprenyl glycosylphosphotransferase